MNESSVLTVLAGIKNKLKKLKIDRKAWVTADVHINLPSHFSRHGHNTWFLLDRHVVLVLSLE